MNIDPQELQKIIMEEATRLKKRMMLEAERAEILKKLQEMEECDLAESGMEEGFGDMFKTDWGKKADEMLKTPNFTNNAVSAVSAWIKNPATIGQWGQAIMQGKNLQDPNQRKEVFSTLVQAYKNLWKAEYVKNQGNMVNTKFDPATGTFEKFSVSTGNFNENKAK